MPQGSRDLWLQYAQESPSALDAPVSAQQEGRSGLTHTQAHTQRSTWEWAHHRHTHIHTVGVDVAVYVPYRI